MNKNIILLRVLSMMIIVFYHCICFYGIWYFPFAKQYESIEIFRGISRIALNVFVFISGYLFSDQYINRNKYRNHLDFIKNKFFRLLYPYLMWSVVVLILFPSDHPLLDIISGHQHLWFLFMLFCIFIIAIIYAKNFLYQKTIKQICELIFIILCNSLLSKLIDLNILRLFSFSNVLTFLPSFLLGGIMVSHKWENYIKLWNSGVFGMMYLFSIIMTGIFLIFDSFPFGSLYINIPTYAFIVFSYVALSKLKYTIPNSVLSLDKCSMGIYIIHHVLIWAFIYYIPFSRVILNKYYILTPIIMFIIVLIISWGTTLLFMKNKFTSRCIGS